MELEEHTDSGISRLYLEENYGLAHDQMVTSAASFVAKMLLTMVTKSSLLGELFQINYCDTVLVGYK